MARDHERIRVAKRAARQRRNDLLVPAGSHLKVNISSRPINPVFAEMEARIRSQMLAILNSEEVAVGAAAGSIMAPECLSMPDTPALPLREILSEQFDYLISHRCSPSCSEVCMVRDRYERAASILMEVFEEQN